ncbi:MAG TPA: response regulator [Anaeromyxobacter sp.]|nr:response regulator [Anaeromyxobacter sp.]
MKNVLIVDDEKSFLLSLVAGLEQYASTFKTLTAANGKEAVEVLRRAKVDLVVTDLNMPEMDGFELLALMTKEHPGVPAMIMTAYATPAIKSRVEALGAFRIQEKPIDFKHLAENVLASLAAMDSGHLKGITLPAFLQLVEAERKTCTLKITSKGLKGFLCFSDGRLLEAATQTERGEAAAYAILSWEDVAIEFNGICKVTADRIGKSVSHILMEAFRLKDERKRAGEASRATHAPQPAPRPQLQLVSDGSERKEERMASIRSILQEFTKLQGVTAVCLVGRDGFLLDSLAGRGIDTEMIGAIASNGYGAAESMGRQLGKGAMVMTMSEFERGPVMSSPVGEDSLIVIIAEKDANLGMIRMKLKKELLALATATAA